MGKFELMALPYAPEALEPVISKETIGFHHGKHLAGYVNNLNGLASPPGHSPKGKGSFGELEALKEMVLHSEGAVLNNAGQILNQTLRWSMPGKWYPCSPEYCFHDPQRRSIQLLLFHLRLSRHIRFRERFPVHSCIP